MKRNKKAEKHKEFLKLQKSLYENFDAQRKLGYKPLDAPIHYGYDAIWVLRDDIDRRHDADEFWALIEHFGVSVWCKNESFTKWNYEQRKEVDIKPYFKEIDENYYNQLQPWCKKYFSYKIGGDKVRWGGVTKYYKVNVPQYYFKLKIEKHYKTHYKVIDEVLKQEAAEIDARLEHQFFEVQKKYWKRHRSDKWGKKMLNKKDRAYNKIALHKNMSTIFAKYDDINDDWGSWLYDWCDDFYEFKYRHKHYGKWIFD
jgi:hypothetical protein